MSQFVNNIISLKCSLGPVAPYRTVYADSTGVIEGFTSAPLLGVSTEIGGDPGKAMDVVIGGIGQLQMAVATTIGTPISSDNNSKGIIATTGLRVVGILLEDSVINQVCRILLVPSVL